MISEDLGAVVRDLRWPRRTLADNINRNCIDFEKKLRKNTLKVGCDTFTSSAGGLADMKGTVADRMNFVRFDLLNSKLGISRVLFPRLQKSSRFRFFGRVGLSLGLVSFERLPFEVLQYTRS
uniref:Uncharacterized protein n=1 Tax=Angiostrongylus cantonensis TaxID=6313 RepID=A0A0K0DEN9_ANGCA